MSAPFVLLGDERLARLAAAGHARAFAVVYERHHQALYRYCRSILRHDADAQDALQSTFAAAFAALARGQRDAPIRPWLFRIAHNEAVSLLRRRRPTAELSALSDACTVSVEEQVAERDELNMLLHDLGQLTERQRAALVMRELSGLSHEEIAIALGTSVGAAKQTIYEARRSLFEFAEGRAMACDDIRKTISDADGRALRSRRVRAHLRECARCSAFAAAIPARSDDLRVLAPALPTLTAAGLLEQIVRAGSGHGARAAGLPTAAAGKATGATLTANALAGVAVVATATVGVTIGVGRFVQAEQHAGRRTAAPAVAPSSSRTAPASRAVIRRPTLAPAVSPQPLRGSTVRQGVAGGSTSATPVHPRFWSRGGGGSSRSVAAGAGGAASSTTPGSVQSAPGQAKTPPGQLKVPPGQGTKAASGRAKTPPGQANTPPGQPKNPTGHAKAPPTQTRTPPGQASNNAVGQPKTPYGQAKVAAPALAEPTVPTPAAAAGAPPAAGAAVVSAPRNSK